MQSLEADLSQPLGLDGSLLPKRHFRDRYELRAYARAALLAKRLLEAPELVARGRAYLDRFVRIDPRQQRIYALWREALGLPVDELVRHLLADDERGASLRETAPVFVVIPADEVSGLVRLAA